MTYAINLDEVDADGAIREAADEVSGDTRLSFLKKAGIAGGTVMGGGAVLSALAPSALAATGVKSGACGRSRAAMSSPTSPATTAKSVRDARQARKVFGKVESIGLISPVLWQTARGPGPALATRKRQSFDRRRRR